MTLAQTLGEKLQAKRVDAQGFLASFKKSDGFKMSQSDIDALAAKRAELNDLTTQFDAAQFAEQNEKSIADFKEPVNGSSIVGNDGFRAQKSLGELFSGAAKSASWNPESKSAATFELGGVSLKTLVQSGGPGYAPANNRTDVVIMTPQRVPVVADLIPQIDTDLTVIKYMLETTYTNAAAARAEGAVFAESADAFTEQNSVVGVNPTSNIVQSIAHSIPVTEEQLADVPSIQAILNDRMVLMLQQKEETELLTGTGSSNRILGFLNASGLGAYTKAGADSAFDAFLKAFTTIRQSGASAWGSANVTGVVLNPVDAQNLMLLRTADGLYIMGNPSGDNPLRIWGIVPTITNAIAQGTSLAGDFRTYSQIYRKLGITLEVGYNNDNFTKGIKTIRAWERLALVVYRPGAFSQINGL